MIGSYSKIIFDFPDIVIIDIKHVLVLCEISRKKNIYYVCEY